MKTFTYLKQIDLKSLDSPGRAEGIDHLIGKRLKQINEMKVGTNLNLGGVSYSSGMMSDFVLEKTLEESRSRFPEREYKMTEFCYGSYDGYGGDPYGGGCDHIIERSL